MKQTIAIAKKELSAFFRSPVALIFLGTFLFITLFSFFWVDTFFRRNIADVRPLFHWLPVLLIFLVAALTMRLWSEEQRMGTLEILLTLPVKTHRLVLGKFLAGIALVAVALALTIGLPLTVSTLGDLDWGPVFGGYLGALLLAGAYLAIGLCISSTTNNPIVALLLTGLAGGALYVVGSDTVAGFAGNRVAEFFHLLGTGSRFESIRRGVIDLRDLIYYGSLCGGFLFLNTVLLEAKRWSEGQSTRLVRSSAKLSAVLVVANLFVLNVSFASVRSLRLDLTERKEYSISPVTTKLLETLDAPLTIRGYFSGKTHPLLAPLVPRIRDLVEEYGAVGGDNVKVEFIDPQQDPKAEKEANEDYGIKSVPFQFADRHEAAVVNSYFNLLVKYGDKYEKLGFEDLIEIKMTGFKDIEVKLRNLEYDLTRAIKKTIYGFQPLEALFARLADKVTLTAYITPDTLPENLKEIPARLTKVAEEIKGRSKGKFEFKQVDPSGAQNENLRKQLYEKHGFKPFAVSMLAQETFYFYVVLESGEHHEPFQLNPEMSEADLRTEIRSALKRMAPGFLKTVGVLSQAPPPQQPRFRGAPPPPQQQPVQLMKDTIGQNYTIKQIDLKDGRVPGSIDVLLLAGPENLSDKQIFAVDQFLMRGGAVVIFGGRFAMEMAPGAQGLAVKKVTSKLDPMLEHWGVVIKDQLVLDPQNEAFPVPVERDLGGFSVREIKLLNYPFWIDVRASGMAKDNPIVGGLPSVTVQWASPIKLEKKKGITATVLLRSSKKSWIQDGTDVQPNFNKFPQDGFGHDDSAKLGPQALAVSLKGRFTSYFKDRKSPFGNSSAGLGGEKNGDPSGEDAEVGYKVIEKSPKGARLVVVASSSFVRDDVLNISRQTGTGRFANNLQLAANLVDWTVEDVDLLSIRSRGTYARTLEPLDDAARNKWEWINYGFVVIGLAAIVGLTVSRRKRVHPIVPVSPPSTTDRQVVSADSNDGER